MTIRITVCLLVALLAACGGGAGGEGGAAPAAAGCTGACGTATPQALTVAEVQQVVSQAVQELQARGALGTIAVVDRVGNVLAVFRMAGASLTVTITSGRGVTGGLENVAIVPSQAAAVAKALTGAYLSS